MPREHKLSRRFAYSVQENVIRRNKETLQRKEINITYACIRFLETQIRYIYSIFLLYTEIYRVGPIFSPEIFCYT